MGHVSNHAQIWAFVTSISHMGQMRDSDWSRQILLRSDWLPTRVALITTNNVIKSSGGSRPSDKKGVGVGGSVSKNTFSALRASV